MLADGFLSDFLANLIATLIGVAIGVPVGIYLDRRKTEREERERTKKILTLIKTELEGNAEAVGHIHEDVFNYFEPVKTQLWKAFSDGGELQWIRDPQLLDSLSAAYYELDRMGFLYERFFEAKMFPGMQNHQQPLVSEVQKYQPECSKKIELARQQISERLK